MKHLFLIFILSIGFMSCTSNNEDKDIIDNSELIGNWVWEETIGGIAGHINETPTSTGSSVELRLFANYSYSIFKNNIKVSSGRYELTLHDNDIEISISYSNEIPRISGVVLKGIIISPQENNLLYIVDGFSDGMTSEFSKIE